MKKITLTLITVLLFGVGTIKAQDQILNDSEPISSGCLNRRSQSNRSNGDEASSLPTIKLTKEGNILSVDILNYESTCSTTGFDMKSRMSGGNDDTPSVFISVVPVIPFEADCICPFNVSYTIRDFEKNKFYLTCWWYDGLVELTDGEPLVLEYKTQIAVIDGLKYRLLKTSHQAKLLNANSWDNETEILQIPSEVEYEGEQYIVSSINLTLFNSNNTITKIIIPKTIKNSEFGSMDGITWNPFSDCLSLETIEVDKDNPAMYSIDGVLFNKDITTILSYPAASPRESYTVPNGVTTMTGHAFINNQHLKKIVLPLSMETLEVRSFANSKSLEEINIPSKVKILPGHLFEDCIKLKSVLIPDGVDNIGAYAFEGCSSLESISIPESVSTIGVGTFKGCTSLKSVFLSPNLKVIPYEMFADCSNLTEFMIPFGITNIGYDAFAGCTAMQSVDLPSSINFIGSYAFRNISNLKDFYCRATAVPNAYYEIFSDTDLSQATLHVPAASVSAYQAVEPWKNFKEIVALPDQNEYRPFIEDGKVWTVKVYPDGYGMVRNDTWTEYYYFNDYTNVGGKTCKRMMYVTNANEDNWVNGVFTPGNLPQHYIGAWYEQDNKVYYAANGKQEPELLYDFTLSTGDNITNPSDYNLIVNKVSGDIPGFKGTYYEMWMENISVERWLEGVGSESWPYLNHPWGHCGHVGVLLSCRVGNEVIYYNSEMDDPYEMGAQKRRFDFTHTTKLQPKVPTRRGEEQSLYGEYNALQLGINLEPIADAYMVRITDETGKVVYEKAINAGSIVGLNIDISNYAKGRYTVTVENSQEVFTGEFEAQATGIEEVNLTPVLSKGEGTIFNLQGQRLSSLQRGLNIVNGQKVYVK